jgi:outer membrane murein-binding lipoprotein Lpp
MQRLLLSAALAVLLTAGCAKKLEAPFDKGVCYALAFDKEGKAKFNVVAENVQNMESCAAQLEGVRLRFTRLGMREDYFNGAYQGSFIFIKPEGVFVSQSYEGVQYPALVRTGDGRLAIPGAMPVDQ